MTGRVWSLSIVALAVVFAGCETEEERFPGAYEQEDRLEEGAFQDERGGLHDDDAEGYQRVPVGEERIAPEQGD